MIGAGAKTVLTFQFGTIGGGSYGVTGTALGASIAGGGIAAGSLTLNGTAIATDGNYPQRQAAGGGHQRPDRKDRRQRHRRRHQHRRRPVRQRRRHQLRHRHGRRRQQLFADRRRGRARGPGDSGTATQVSAADIDTP
jgi:hypothetical protein